jgi:hypothetical protein
MAGGIVFRVPRQLTPLSSPTQPQPSGPGYSLPARVQVLLHRSRLDRLLCEEADPSQTPALSLRARQLQSTRHRLALAKGLERIVEATERRSSDRNATLPIDRDQVIRARRPLLQLAERLRGPDVVDPRGVAMVGRLLTDEASPIYSPAWSRADAPPGALESHARGALAALEDRTTDPTPPV